MKRLWSPWRSEHIERIAADPDGYGSDIFRRIGEDSDRDEDNLVLWRGRMLFVVMNLFPYNNGHLLIAPYRAVQTYQELSEDEQSELARTIGMCIRWLEHALRPDGVNVGMNIGKAAGAGIPHHLHAHVVPRWTGDTSFMSSAADTRVIPESIHETYRKLKQAVSEVSA
jgi:ATP adenylyltransferase